MVWSTQHDQSKCGLYSIFACNFHIQLNDVEGFGIFVPFTHSVTYVSRNITSCKYFKSIKVFTVSKLNVVCVAHRRVHASNALPLPVRRRWSPLPSPSVRHQPTLQDHGYGLVYHARLDDVGDYACLLSQLSLGTQRVTIELNRQPKSGNVTWKVTECINGNM